MNGDDCYVILASPTRKHTFFSYLRNFVYPGSFLFVSLHCIGVHGLFEDISREGVYVGPGGWLGWLAKKKKLISTGDSGERFPLGRRAPTPVTGKKEQKKG